MAIWDLQFADPTSVFPSLPTDGSIDEDRQSKPMDLHPRARLSQIVSGKLALTSENDSGNSGNSQTT